MFDPETSPEKNRVRVADSDKLSGAKLGSNNHGSEYILRGKIQDGGHGRR